MKTKKNLLLLVAASLLAFTGCVTVHHDDHPDDHGHPPFHEDHPDHPGDWHPDHP